MNAKEFFDEVVAPNYLDAHQHPNNFKLVCNAITCMNTVAEFVALERLGYPTVLTRSDLETKANEIRKNNPPLCDLKYWVDTLKHVRKLTNAKTDTHEVTRSSTSILVSDPSSWQHLNDLIEEAHVKMATFKELK
ncbi:MAG: hypothetical protein ACXV2A_04050 [Halobacteriota archaeon]